MRLFIAIELEDNIKNALLEIQGSMKKQNITGNYTPNLSDSLFFLCCHGRQDQLCLPFLFFLYL